MTGERAPADAVRPQVVVARLTALGDSLLAVPALEALRVRFPRHRVVFVTGAAQAPLFSACEAVDAVVPYRAADHGSRAGMAALAAELLRAGPVDVYVDLQHKVRTVRLGRRLHPARRIAFRRRTALQAFLALLGRDRPRTGRHATALYLDALAPLGVAAPPGEAPLPARLPLPPEARAAATKLAPGPWIGVAPGARWATKRWAPARFAQVARALAAETGARIALVSGPGDAAEAEAFEAALGAPPDLRTADLGLAAMMGVLSRCEVLVAGDTGPGHLAAAAGTPVVSIFGPTPADRWRPAGDGEVVRRALPCAPCSNHGTARCPLGHHACLVDLEVGAVLAAARAVLAGRRRGEALP